jgi:hypothetical protein
MFESTRLIRLLGVGLLLTGACAAARAEVLVKEDFEAAAPGETPEVARPAGKIVKWEGDKPDQPLGRVGVAAGDASGEAGKSLLVSDSSPADAQAPSVRVTWKPPASGALVVGWKFMVPVAESYLSPAFLGGGWTDAAAVLVLENGEILVQYGEDGARLSLGSYKPNTWHAVRFEFDLAKRTFHAYVDGAKCANGLAFQPGNKSVQDVQIYADYAAQDHKGGPVLRLDDVTVEALPAMPAAAPPAPTTTK